MMWIMQMFYIVFGFVLTIVLALVGAFCALRKLVSNRRAKMHKLVGNVVSIGLFHPYCDAGGGGERVLWCVVRALQAKYDNIKIVIYTGDVDSAPSAILEKARNLFNISIDEESTKFIYLRNRHWVESKKYPYFTLLGQSLGSLVLGLEALLKFPPDIFIDTMGYTFVLPLFRFVGYCKVGCYIHYPIISADMLSKVKNRQLSHNNHTYVVRNPFLTWLKLAYYHMFAKLYSYAGRSSQTIMVNSSWTENHILDLWRVPFKTHRVYPPCEISHLKALPRNQNGDSLTILSVGQFRPEKDHPLQLQAIYELRTLLAKNEDLWSKIRLVIIGSCRNKEDYVRLKNMQDLSKHLSLEDTVEFKVNVPYQELLQHYQSAKICIHTMWNEHFGIGIVECMAAGLIVVAHRSGGPLLDIIETSEGCQTGYLATDVHDYASCILSIICNSKEENDLISSAARSSVERFSEKEFEVNFLRAVSPLFIS